jgi:hypothetical protein
MVVDMYNSCHAGLDHMDVLDGDALGMRGIGVTETSDFKVLRMC